MSVMRFIMIVTDEYIAHVMMSGHRCAWTLVAARPLSVTQYSPQVPFVEAHVVTLRNTMKGSLIQRRMLVTSKISEYSRSGHSG